jgi:Protein of unknown function (DUF3311)
MSRRLDGGDEGAQVPGLPIPGRGTGEAGAELLDELAELEAREVHHVRPWAMLLLLIPIAAIIYPPLYSHDKPTLGGIPFFVWYQLVAVAFGGVVTAVVYVLRGSEGKPARR